jgi:hypothetical protein
MINSKKYILAFIITFTIFISGVFIVNTITTNKIEQVRNLENNIAINILSLETQFDLLQEQSCKNISQSILSQELSVLAERLNFMENNLGSDDEEVLRLKKYYSLLEIKDFILMQKISKRCKKDLHYILYFYSNKGDCKDCKHQGYALTKALKKSPGLRVYSFDYNLELSALETLKKINGIKEPLPALVIDSKNYNGFVSFDDLLEILPDIKNASSTPEIKEG